MSKNIQKYLFLALLLLPVLYIGNGYAFERGEDRGGNMNRDQFNERRGGNQDFNRRGNENVNVNGGGNEGQSPTYVVPNQNYQTPEDIYQQNLSQPPQ